MLLPQIFIRPCVVWAVLETVLILDFTPSHALPLKPFIGSNAQTVRARKLKY